MSHGHAEGEQGDRHFGWREYWTGNKAWWVWGSLSQFSVEEAWPRRVVMVMGLGQK